MPAPSSVPPSQRPRSIPSQQTPILGSKIGTLLAWLRICPVIGRHQSRFFGASWSCGGTPPPPLQPAGAASQTSARTEWRRSQRAASTAQAGCSAACTAGRLMGTGAAPRCRRCGWPASCLHSCPASSTSRACTTRPRSHPQCQPLDATLCALPLANRSPTPPAHAPAAVHALWPSPLPRRTAWSLSGPTHPPAQRSRHVAMSAPGRLARSSPRAPVLLPWS